jgi:hypothetical protein
MSLKQPRSRESFPAHVALVAEVVREHVHGKGRHAHVRFATGRTLLRGLRVQASVGLLVSGQVGRGSVLLSTLRTRVLGFLTDFSANWRR